MVNMCPPVAPAEILGEQSDLSAVTDQAGRDAERLLKRVWRRGAGKTPLPVDPVLIARRLGIDVYETQLPKNVSAALVKEYGEDPTIALSSRDSSNRKRFSCAHELGHFVSKTDQPEEYEYIDFRDPRSSTGLDRDEVYANNFAAALLMPSGEVRRLKNEGYSAVEMAWEFDVSLEAMTNRLSFLRLS